MQRPPYEVLSVSAGSFPRGQVHSLALQLLAEQGLPTAGLRSKPREDFAAPGAPALDFVFTICDQAAGEAWPGQPVTAHWGLPDPAAEQGSDAQRMLPFHKVFQALERCIRLFVSLPFAGLDRMALTRRVEEIGRVRPDNADGIAS